MQEEFKLVEFTGKDDLTCWLEEHNGEQDPMIFPLWPADYPKHVPVCLSFEGELAVVLSRAAMLAARDPGRLWFCNITSTDLLAATNADHGWFA